MKFLNLLNFLNLHNLPKSLNVPNRLAFNFNPRGFVDGLPTMGKGMLGIFLVIGIIVLVTMALNALTGKKK